MCCHPHTGPHWSGEPSTCCHTHAEDLPANAHNEQGEPLQPLPGWTVQQGNAAPYVEPLIVCAFCDGEYSADEIHLHTRVTHGYEMEITPENPYPHPNIQKDENHAY